MMVTMAEEQGNDDSTVTRIYVEGLPPSTTKDQIRTHFAATGKYIVTDAHIIPDRRIAFVGFTSHEQARSAVRYFNKSFVRMSKISVTLARPIEVRRDAKGQGVPVSERDSKKRKRNVRDDGEFARMQLSNQTPSAANGQITKSNNEPIVTSEEKENQPEEQPWEGIAGDADNVGKPKSDTDWLRRKTKRTLDLLDEPEVETACQNMEPVGTDALEQEDTDDDIHPEQPRSKTLHTPEEPQTSSASVPNARLFIRNLPFDTREAELRAVFAPHGRISEVSSAFFLSVPPFVMIS